MYKIYQTNISEIKNTEKRGLEQLLKIRKTRADASKGFSGASEIYKKTSRLGYPKKTFGHERGSTKRPPQPSKAFGCDAVSIKRLMSACPAGAPRREEGRFIGHGFTLIELLVVVLIIGILAAVALPQYQKTVRKARMAEVLVYLHAYAQGEEAYFMANGIYTDYPADLAVTMPFPKGAVSNSDKGYFYVPDKGIWLDVIGTVGVPSTYVVRGGLGHMPEGGSGYGDFVKDLTYTVYLANSTQPGKTSCSGRTAEYQALCKTLKY